MARRTFDVIDVAEILVHWHAGRSLNEMSGALGVDRKTMRKYVAPAVAAGIVPGGPAKSEGEWQEPGPGVVPGAGGHPAAAGDLAGDRRAPRLHRGAAEGRGADVDGPPAAAGRAGAGGERGELPPVCRRERPGGGPPVAGDRVEPASGRGRGAGADRLRDARPVAGPGDREAPYRLGVRDGAGLLAAHVRPAGPEDGPAGLDRVPRGGVRVLRRRPGPAGAGQPEDRGRQARPLRPEAQPVLCGDGRALRLPGRPGPGAEAP